MTLPLFAAACSLPKFVADKTISMEVSAADVAVLRCETHNGDIAIESSPRGDVVEVIAQLEVRGHTQAQADEHLSSMQVRHTREGDLLRLFGDHPRARLNGFSPRYSFTLRVPAQVALDLQSHNGNIHTASHGARFALESHNGDIEVDLADGGALDGTITTHNGDVVVSLPQDVHGYLEAATHNGRITTPPTLHEAAVQRRSLRCRIGNEDSTGRLRIETHNGDIQVR